MTVKRTEIPAGGEAPIRRERAGIGSYEDPADTARKSAAPARRADRGAKVQCPKDCCNLSLGFQQTLILKGFLICSYRFCAASSFILNFD